MPDEAQILEGLHRIANEAFALAVLWHAWFAAGAVALARGRVSPRRAGEMLAIPLASVSGVAFAYGLPFNGVLMGALALLLVALARGMSTGSAAFGAAWAVGAGAALMVFGWIYPEFLERPPQAFLVGAPLGLLPCPTLAFLVGATLFLGGLDSRAWSLALAAAGLFYGMFGATRLGVRIDAILALGSAALGVSAALPMMPRRRAT